MRRGKQKKARGKGGGGEEETNTLLGGGVAGEERVLVKGDGRAVVVVARKELLVVADDAREEGAERRVDHLVVEARGRRQRARRDAERLPQLEQARLRQQLERGQRQRHVAAAHVDDHERARGLGPLHRAGVALKRVGQHADQKRLFCLLIPLARGKECCTLVRWNNLGHSPSPYNDVKASTTTVVIIHRRRRRNCKQRQSGGATQRARGAGRARRPTA